MRVASVANAADRADPFHEHDDATLNDALRRSHFLVDPSQNLDTQIDTDGSNLSHAQRALLGLARALVRRSKIVMCVAGPIKQC